jgi:hypothetical protein
MRPAVYIGKNAGLSEGCMTPLKAFIVAVSILICSAAAAEVRVYDVEAQYRQEIYNALDRIFTADEPAEQRVSISMLPTGQILVDAPPARQAEIAELLEKIKQSAAPETPSVSLRYWVLFGVAGEQETTAVPSMLRPLLPELRAALGNLNFSVVDTQRGLSLVVECSGESGHRARGLEL